MKSFWPSLSAWGKRLMTVQKYDFSVCAGEVDEGDFKANDCGHR